MRTRLVLMALLVICFTLSVGLPISASSSAYEFVLGFKTLHDAIPEVVGDCTGPLNYNPANGDGLQYTKNGMLVWRKADNWTAFTNGYRTWINGPNGLQDRLNTERFPWEAAAPTPASSTCSVTKDNVSFDSNVTMADGTVVFQGTARNPCDQPVSFMVDTVGYSDKEGQPITDGPTTYVENVPPKSSKTFTASLPLGASCAWYRRASYGFVDQDVCLGMQTSRCLNVDRWLTSAVVELKGTQSGYWLLRVAAENGVTIRREKLPIDVLGKYSSTTKTVSIDTRLDTYSSWVRAAVLAHELQHAADDAAGLASKTSSECYQAEEGAFKREAEIWGTLWNHQLPQNIDSAHAELNDITLTISRDPVGFARSLISLYDNECGQ